MTTQTTSPLMMGAVAYAPKVVTIWEGFKEYFRRHDFEFDYILYSNYERQVQAQFDGSIAFCYSREKPGFCLGFEYEFFVSHFEFGESRKN